jgi:hypothetical protein
VTILDYKASSCKKYITLYVIKDNVALIPQHLFDKKLKMSQKNHLKLSDKVTFGSRHGPTFALVELGQKKVHLLTESLKEKQTNNFFLF